LLDSRNYLSRRKKTLNEKLSPSDSQKNFEEELEQALEEEEKKTYPSYPNELFVIPITARPFFPGMAAPILIEPGLFYEVLKLLAKSEYKYVALLLTKKEKANVQSVGFSDLHSVGVIAKILRIIPIEI
jgi:ATP-dependent Lon protease